VPLRSPLLRAGFCIDTETVLIVVAHMQPQRQRIADETKTLWRIDPSHTSIEFSIRNLWFMKVKGSLQAMDGIIELDESAIERSLVVATLNAGSINTGNKRRDAHLRSAAFLDAVSYPDIRFTSSQVGPGKDRDMIAVNGSLTIKELSRHVALEVTEVDRSRSPGGEEVIYYTATTELDRFELGINYGRLVIGRKVQVVINVQASRMS
jgi:polyisoprenoid-binding protein YceI